MDQGVEANKIPLVSVVIATFNRAGFLPETLDSVLQQKFDGFEVIVVDDGSTDNTKEALRPYGDRIRYVIQQNRGPSAARNLGVRLARAPWIAIQDSDDLCGPNYLQSLYEFARDHQDCAMIFANGAYLGGKEHNRETIIPREKSRRLARDGVGLVDLFEKSIVRLQAALIAKNCYDAVGGHDEGLRISMDLDLAFRIFMRYPVAYLDDVVFFYRKHEGNSGRNQELRLVENIRVIEKLLRDFPQAAKTLGRARVARRLAYRYYRLAKGRWREGRKEAAREALQQAVALSPFALKYRLYQMRWA
jgi:glycosyltransferase involved in cell wall biosynthesis